MPAGLPVSPVSTYLLADRLAPLGALLSRDARLQWSDFNAFFRTVGLRSGISHSRLGWERGRSWAGLVNSGARKVAMRVWLGRLLNPQISCLTCMPSPALPLLRRWRRYMTEGSSRCRTRPRYRCCSTARESAGFQGPGGRGSLGRRLPRRGTCRSIAHLTYQFACPVTRALHLAMGSARAAIN